MTLTSLAAFFDTQAPSSFAEHAPLLDHLRSAGTLEAQPVDSRVASRGRLSEMGRAPDLRHVGALALPSSQRFDDLRPFAQKMRVYAREFVNDSYGAANAAILSGMVGMGVANGGYMILLRLLGNQGSSLPVVGFMTLTAFSMILSGASKTFTSHQRDNQDIGLLGPYRDTVTGAQYCRMYFQCGLATTATNATLLGGTALFARQHLSANGLLALSVAAKSVEACLKGTELGYWNCIKTHLGNADTRRFQRDLNRTIVGIETITQAVAFNAATMATYVALGDTTDPARTLQGTMQALTLGCAILLASNAYFPVLERQLGLEP